MSECVRVRTRLSVRVGRGVVVVGGGSRLLVGVEAVGEEVGAGVAGEGPVVADGVAAVGADEGQVQVVDQHHVRRQAARAGGKDRLVQRDSSRK